MWSKIWYPPDRNRVNKIFKRTEDNLPKPIPELQRTDISFEKFPPQSKQVNLFTSISPLSLESALSLSMNMMSSSKGIKLSLWGSKIRSCLTTLCLFFKLSLVFLLIALQIFLVLWHFISSLQWLIFFSEFRCFLTQSIAAKNEYLMEKNLKISDFMNRVNNNSLWMHHITIKGGAKIWNCTRLFKICNFYYFPTYTICIVNFLFQSRCHYVQKCSKI